MFLRYHKQYNSTLVDIEDKSSPLDITLNFTELQKCILVGLNSAAI
jgi:hypothetical protein